MSDRATPYSADLLPQGFSYPAGYLRLAEPGAVPKGLIWWFPGEEFGHAASEWKLRNHWAADGWHALAGIDPIPFARNGDFAAFFDGNHRSGDPPVVVVDLGNRQKGRRLANFEAWRQEALEDSGL